MRAWVLPVAFRPQLIALVAGATYSPSYRRRRGIFADPRAGVGKDIPLR